MRGFSKTVAVAVLLLVGMVAGMFVALELFGLLAWIVYSACSYPFTSGDEVSTMPTLLGLFLFSLWLIGCFVSMIAGIGGGAAAAIWFAGRIP